MGFQGGQRSSGIIAAALLLAATGGLLAACSGPPTAASVPDRSKPPPPAVDVAFEAIADPPDLVRGDLARVRVRVANRTTDRLLVLSALRIEPDAPPGVPAPSPSTLSFQTTRRGALTFERDHYRLTPSADLTQSVFNTGTLFPRESLDFAMPVRVLGANVRVRLEYDLLPFDRAAEFCYFHADKGEFRRRADLTAMADNGVGAFSGTIEDRLHAIRSGDDRYAMPAALELVQWPVDDATMKAKVDTLPESAWYYKQLVLSERKSMRSNPDGSTSDDPRRRAPLVVFVRSLAMDAPATSATVVAFQVRDGDFPLSAALAQAPPGTLEAVSYFSLHGSWLIRAGGATVLVHPTGRSEIPDIDPAVLDAIDAVQENVVEVDFEKGSHLALEGAYQVVQSKEDDGRVRSAAFIPKSDFVGFLRRMRELGRSWRVGLTYRAGRAVPFVTY